MKTLLLVLFMVSCGTDPDDFQPKQSDGCRSDDLACQDEAKNANASTTATGEEALAKDDASVGNTQSISVESEVTVKTQVSVDGQPIDVAAAETAPIACQEGKICRGSTKDDVLDIMGEPQTIKMVGQQEVWQWDEPMGEYYLCGTYYCTISFVKNSVTEQLNISAKFLDLANF